MRWCQFLLVLVLMPSRYAAKGIEFPFDDTLDELDPDEGPWDPGPSLFVDSDEFYSTTAEDSFFSAGSGPYTAVSADNASTCMIEDPPLSRIRERSGVCENENEFSGSSTAVYDPRLPGTLAEQEEIKSQWCPEEAYHGVLDIPVCSQYEDIQILPSDLTDVDTGEPLSATGLKTIVTGSLSMSCLPYVRTRQCWVRSREKIMTYDGVYD